MPLPSKRTLSPNRVMVLTSDAGVESSWAAVVAVGLCCSCCVGVEAAGFCSPEGLSGWLFSVPGPEGVSPLCSGDCTAESVPLDSECSGASGSFWLSLPDSSALEESSGAVESAGLLSVAESCTESVGAAFPLSAAEFSSCCPQAASVQSMAQVASNASIRFILVPHFSALFISRAAANTARPGTHAAPSAL